MPTFRENPTAAWASLGGPADPSAGDLGRLIDAALRTSHFFVHEGSGLEPEHLPSQELTWEVFKGRLLDRTQTTRRRSFAAWNLYGRDAEQGRSPDPLLSVLHDPA